MKWKAGLEPLPRELPRGRRPEECPDLPPRFICKVEVDPERGCWLWTASLTPYGYGRIGRGARGTGWTSAHRFAFERVIEMPPSGTEFDHLCRTPRCANPWHVEPVSHRVNLRRGRQCNDSSGMCRKGLHSWIPENILVEGNGVRRCLPCRKVEERARTIRRAAERRAAVSV